MTQQAINTARSTDLDEAHALEQGDFADSVAAYSEDDDDAVTRQIEAPRSEEEWMVQLDSLDRRMLTEREISTLLRAGALDPEALVWRSGMQHWQPLGSVPELAALLTAPPEGESDEPEPHSGIVETPIELRLPAAPPLANVSYTGAPSYAPVASYAPVVTDAHAPRVIFSDAPHAQDRAPRLAMVIASSIAALAAIAGTCVALSRGGVFESPRAAAALLVTETLVQAPNAADAVRATSSASPALSDATREPKAEPAAMPAQPGAGTTVTVSASDDGRDARRALLAEAVGASIPDPREGSDDEGAATHKATSETPSPAAVAPQAPKSKPAIASAAPKRRVNASKAKATTRAARRAKVSTATKARTARAPAAAAAVTPAAPAVASTGSTFDRNAARAALDDAAAQAKNCQPAGGPTGSGRVQVRYATTGKVTSAKVLTAAFADSTAAGCIEMVFRRATVPEFNGGPITVEQGFQIP